MTFAAFLLPCGEARRGANSSRLPVSSYSSRTKGQDREATDRMGVSVPVAGRNAPPCPLATYAGPIKDVAPILAPRAADRTCAYPSLGRGQLASRALRLSAFSIAGPERSGVRRLAICHAAFHVGAYATGNAAVNPAHGWAAGRRRIHQIRSLKLNVRQELAGQAHRYGAKRLPRTDVVVSFTGLSVFHDRNSSEGTNGNVQKHDGKIRHVEC